MNPLACSADPSNINTSEHAHKKLPACKNASTSFADGWLKEDSLFRVDYETCRCFNVQKEINSESSTQMSTQFGYRRQKHAEPQNKQYTSNRHKQTLVVHSGNTASKYELLHKNASKYPSNAGISGWRLEEFTFEKTGKAEPKAGNHQNA